LILVVANLNEKETGGNKRALRAVKEYIEHGLEVGIVVLTSEKKPSLKIKNPELLRHIVGIAYLQGIPFVFGGRSLTDLLGMKKVYLKMYSQPFSVDAVVSMHESPEALIATKKLANLYGVPKVAILQLPPFYANSIRVKNINNALIRYYGLLMMPFYSLLQMISIKKLWNKSKDLLKDFDLIMPISRSIAFEMGKMYETVHPVDPGVSLDESDLQNIQEINKKIKKSKNLLIFPARADPLKGIAEAIYALKLIKNKQNEVKLLITGKIGRKSSLIIRLLSNRLRVSQNVILTGYLPTRTLYKYMRMSKVAVYPSHIDGFPYSVLECLSLGTPVVAYGIPALAFNYSRADGVYLVPEGDVAALASQVINLLSSNNSIEQKFEHADWKSIISNEISILYRFIGIQKPINQTKTKESNEH